MNKQKILYISYNGVNEALGASQVLSYLYKLSADYEYHLVSLEKPNDFSDKEKMTSLNSVLKRKNIHWYPIAYKTDKIGKNLNFFRLLNKVNSVIKTEDIRFLHCRSYFPAFVALLLKRKYNLKYLFDTRGFAFDERADVGSIKRGSLTHKAFKKIEKKLYLNAAGVNKLSHEGKRTILANELFRGGDKVTPITVIPTCTDTERFIFFERDYSTPVKIGYVGTATGWYDFDRTLRALVEIGKRMDYRFIIFNGGQHEFIKKKLSEYSIPFEKVTLEKVPFDEMPSRLSEMDIALFYIYPFFSKRASAATKLGEFLSSGIPVITNAGVGDHEYYINNYGVGQIIDFDILKEYDFSQIIKQLCSLETAKKCRLLAEKYFTLEKGVKDYKKLYKEIFV